eukprot:g18593.t1
MIDAYDVLGLQLDCKEEDVKKAYHKMSLQYHPDKVGGGDDATKKFNEIKSAREPPGGAPGSWEPRGVPSSSVRRG